MNRKTLSIVFWTTTVFIFLIEGLMPALTSQSKLAKEGIRHLGYPEYFGIILVFFKVAGVLFLILPKISARLKEWAYAGFVFDFLFASLSHFAVDGLNFQTFFPLIVLTILLISYFSYHRLRLIN